MRYNKSLEASFCTRRAGVFPRSRSGKATGSTDPMATERKRMSLVQIESSPFRQGMNDGALFGVTPYYQTTLEVNTLHLESRPFQTRWEVHTPGWNGGAWCYTHPR